MSTYTIGRVAERSGFAASALRYYEQHGLLEPAGRTDAGYRLYDDDSLECLRFISCGKELGCTLAEIAELAELWEAEDCAPVQARLHELVTDKIHDAQRRSTELITFTAQLQIAAVHLGDEPVDGACGEGCACLADHPASIQTSAMATSVPVVLSERGADDRDIACTLPHEEMPDRAEDWKKLVNHVRRREPVENGAGVRLVLDPEVPLGELARLAVAEQGCCAFFAFTITVDHRGIALEVRAPRPPPTSSPPSSEPQHEHPRTSIGLPTRLAHPRVRGRGMPRLLRRSDPRRGRRHRRHRGTRRMVPVAGGGRRGRGDDRRGPAVAAPPAPTRSSQPAGTGTCRAVGAAPCRLHHGEQIMSAESVTVFFDYTCPFAHRAHRWFDHLPDVETEWRPFSLLEHNYRGDGPPVWRLPERADDISLLIFAGHRWVQADEADLDQYRHDVFHTWHETDTRLDAGGIVDMVNRAGAHGGTEQLRAHFHDAEADHDDARHHGVFGSPTLVFPDGGAAFVKLHAPPPAEQAAELLHTAQATAGLDTVEEIKRPRAPHKPDARHLDIQPS